MDVKKCFDSIDITKLIELLENSINLPKKNSVIGMMLLNFQRRSEPNNKKKPQLSDLFTKTKKQKPLPNLCVSQSLITLMSNDRHPYNLPRNKVVREYFRFNNPRIVDKEVIIS